jgi:hypothetical protein
MADRPIPTPSGTPTDIIKVFRIMANRRRETQPEVNQPFSDSVPSDGSGDQ